MKLAEFLENGPRAWPGGYPIYGLMDDGETLCFNCCKNEENVHEGGDADGWRFETAYIYWEGPGIACAHCSAILESAYGDPGAEPEPEDN
jgi:hypothetical protein